LDTLKGTIDIPFYREWTGVEAKTRTENVEHVYKELSQPGKRLGLRRPQRHPHAADGPIGRPQPVVTAAPAQDR
ncbi:MAG: hypothetical protein ACKOTB_10425, partial [Planctomycetia bacterium]